MKKEMKAKKKTNYYESSNCCSFDFSIQQKKKPKKNPSTTDHRPITTDFGYFVIDLLFFLISFADEDVKNGGEGKSRAPSIALFVGRREREKEGVADLKKKGQKKKRNET